MVLEILQCFSYNTHASKKNCSDTVTDTDTVTVLSVIKFELLNHKILAIESIRDHTLKLHLSITLIEQFDEKNYFNNCSSPRPGDEAHQIASQSDEVPQTLKLKRSSFWGWKLLVIGPFDLENYKESEEMRSFVQTHAVAEI